MARSVVMQIFIALLASLHCATATEYFAEPFELSDVTLAGASDFHKAFKRNEEYLLLMQPDNLLYNFRLTAGMPTPGESYGGWESSNVEIRGQFIGHYLTATALSCNHSENAALEANANKVVEGLREVQDKWGNGYLSAFPPSHFDRLEALQPVWAPYYVIHKIMAGLLAQHVLLGHSDALATTLKMADYFCNRSQDVVKTKGREHWNAVLNTEFGGMNEVLYELHAMTGNETLASCARLFDKPAFWDPLSRGRDALAGLHANTHLAQVNGFVARYEATGDDGAKSVVQNFYDILTSSHSFATGGNNWNEFWFAPRTVADAVNERNHGDFAQETCTVYNTLKVVRSLFRWTGSADYADYYERSLLNGILGVQRKLEPHEVAPDGKTLGGGRDPNLQRHLLHADDHDHGHGHVHEHHPLPRSLYDGQRHLLLAPEDSSSLRLQTGTPIEGSWPALLGSGVGEYLYYTPLGPADYRGETEFGGAAGWGSPFDSFWCCYGTSVESFAKLADSIWFRRGPSLSNRSTPELVVNLFASSAVSWREQNLRASMHADLYSHGEARLRIKLDKLRAGAEADSSSIRLRLHLRIPAWSQPARPGSLSLLRQRGEPAAEEPMRCEQERPAKGGSFCVLGPDWKAGDTVVVRLPMPSRFEAVEDDRAETKDLAALLMGPHVMVGLTHDQRRLALSKTHPLPETLAQPPPFAAKGSALVTMAPRRLAKLELIPQNRDYPCPGCSSKDRDVPPEPRNELVGDPPPPAGNLRLVQGGAFKEVGRGGGLDATLEIHTGLESCDACPRCGVSRALKADDERKPPGLCVSLAVKSHPGHYLGTRGKSLQLVLLGPEDLAKKEGRQAATFVALRVVGAGAEEARGELAAAGREAEDDGEKDDGEDNEDGINAIPGVARLHARTDFDGSLPQLEALSEAFKGPLVYKLASTLPEGGFVEAQDAAGKPVTEFETRSPEATAYPPGTRLLEDDNRQWLVAPLGQITEELYTAHFEIKVKGA